MSKSIKNTPHSMLSTPEHITASANSEEDEINLLELWKVIWQNRNIIYFITSITILLTAIYAVTLPNIYEARAVIIPIQSNQNNFPSGLMGVAANFAGISIGDSLGNNLSMKEVKILLKSQFFKKKLIEKYNILPYLFPDLWDKEKKKWKNTDPQSQRILKYLNPHFLLTKIINKLHPKPASVKLKKSKDGEPDIRQAIRVLESMLKVDVKTESLIISSEAQDPEFAVDLLNNILIFLKQSLKEDALRIARLNKEYLTKQLDTTTDPIIKNKIYELFANQLEKETMAGNIESYAFKVIDPPMIPDHNIKPKRGVMVVTSAIISFFLSILFVFLIDIIKRARKGSCL